MGIKADKTFEEIVERIVALFGPQSTVSSPIDSHTGDSTNSTNPVSDTTKNTADTSKSLIPAVSQDDPGPA